MAYEPARSFSDLSAGERDRHPDETAAAEQCGACDWEYKEDSRNDSDIDFDAQIAGHPFRCGDVEEIELPSSLADIDHVFAHANRRQYRDMVEHADHRNRRRGPTKERFGSDAVEDYRFDRNRKKRVRRRNDYQ